MAELRAALQAAVPDAAPGSEDEVDAATVEATAPTVMSPTPASAMTDRDAAPSSPPGLATDKTVPPVVQSAAAPAAPSVRSSTTRTVVIAAVGLAVGALGTFLVVRSMRKPAEAMKPSPNAAAGTPDTVGMQPAEEKMAIPDEPGTATMTVSPATAGETAAAVSSTPATPAPVSAAPATSRPGRPGKAERFEPSVAKARLLKTAAKPVNKCLNRTAGHVATTAYLTIAPDGRIERAVLRPMTVEINSDRGMVTECLERALTKGRLPPTGKEERLSFAVTKGKVKVPPLYESLASMDPLGAEKHVMAKMRAALDECLCPDADIVHYITADLLIDGDGNIQASRGGGASLRGKGSFADRDRIFACLKPHFETIKAPRSKAGGLRSITINADRLCPRVGLETRD